MKIFYMHSASALSKKVEDNEGRERDVSRKETFFKSLIMCKVRGSLMPFTTAQIKRRQKKISLRKDRHLNFPRVCATVEISPSGLPVAQAFWFFSQPILCSPLMPCPASSDRSWALGSPESLLGAGSFPPAQPEPFAFRRHHLTHLVGVCFLVSRFNAVKSIFTRPASFSVSAGLAMMGCKVTTHSLLLKTHIPECLHSQRSASQATLRVGVGYEYWTAVMLRS